MKDAATRRKDPLVEMNDRPAEKLKEDADDVQTSDRLVAPVADDTL